MPQETLVDIQRKLAGRIRNLSKISNAYYKYIAKFAVIVGTDKDDYFEIERRANGITKVTGYRIKKEGKTVIFHQKKYHAKHTKEIWIYGLDDTDTFKVFGDHAAGSVVRIVGGQNNDVYHILQGQRVKIYDYKTKKTHL